MELMAKRFNELSLDEYHELLKLRCAVFLVEQQSPYQEVDDADKEEMCIRDRSRASSCMSTTMTSWPAAESAWATAHPNRLHPTTIMRALFATACSSFAQVFSRENANDCNGGGRREGRTVTKQ